MADLTNKKTNYISRLTALTSALLADLDALVAIRAEWNEVGYGVGAPAEITADEIAINFPYMDVADLTSAMSTIDAFVSLRGAGHGTNLQKLRG